MKKYATGKDVVEELGRDGPPADVALRPREQYKSPYKLPEGLDWELLLILMEECNEVSQRSSKAQRFGAREIQQGQGENNIQRLSKELGELLYVVDMLRERGLIDDASVEAGRQHKKEQLKKYLQNQ